MDPDDEKLAILDASLGRTAGDVLAIHRRMLRLEAVMFGSNPDESGGLRATIAVISLKMDQMTFWFKVCVGAMFLAILLFGPSEVQGIIKMFAGKVVP